MFGEIEEFGPHVSPQMELNDVGEMIQQTWEEMSEFYDVFFGHEFVVIPNHTHGIIEIREKRSLSLPDIVHRYKTMTTKRYIDGVTQYGWPRFNKRLWQRNYWERVIRNDDEMKNISEYIKHNPLTWDRDTLNPK